MRRNDREITDPKAIEDILRRATVCRLAMVDNGQPYLIPLTFGYSNNTLYFHSASSGRKMEVLHRNPRICFEADIDHELRIGEKACDYGMKFRSVIGYGSVQFISDPAEKIKGLDILMSKYAAGPFEYAENHLKNIVIYKVAIESISAKAAGYPVK
jgi:uncharacterized protein